jgi:hypothetical protein
MPTGTPFTMKCPACRRGAFGHASPDLGVRKTGRVEKQVTRSKHRGTGGGGCSFRGHRGEVECLDCGHRWYSTHPDSGRVSASKINLDGTPCS